MKPLLVLLLCAVGAGCDVDTCPTCRGKGKTVCTICVNGRSDCGVCVDGKSEGMTCHFCKGAGRVSCQRCGGTGWNACYVCRGRKP